MSKKKRSICLVCPQGIDQDRNIRFRFFYESLALDLAEGGYEIFLLYYLTSPLKKSSFVFPKNLFDHYGVYPCFIENEIEGVGICDPIPIKVSYTLFLWLKERNFDYVHFPFEGGVGYYSILAKFEELAFQNTCLGINLFSLPLLTRKNKEYSFIRSVENLYEDYMEKESVRWGDFLVTTNSFFLKTLETTGWSLPEKKGCLGYPFHPSIIQNKAWRQTIQRLNIPMQIVCVGGSEKKKEINKAFLEKYPHQFDKIYFLDFFKGLKENVKDNEVGIEEIQNLLYLLPNPLLIALEGKEGLEIVFLTALVLDIPMMVSLEAIGYFPFESMARERLVFEDLNDLFIKLELILQREWLLGFDEKTFRGKWVQWHKEFPLYSKMTQNIRITDRQPKISVVLVHHDRPRYLEQAINSLLVQRYPNFEVVLIDDGSEREESQVALKNFEKIFKEKGWILSRESNQYLGAARNRGAELASGEYLLFMDDDNIAKSNELEIFAQVAIWTGADILTAVKDFFTGEELFKDKSIRLLSIPLGGDLASGFYENRFGDANALVKKKAFEELGGFTKDFGIGHEDWEFFSKAVLCGYKLLVVPLPLFWYRTGHTSMLSNTLKERNFFRSLRAYIAGAGDKEWLKGVLLLAHYLYLEKIFFLSRSFETKERIFGMEKSKLIISLLEEELDKERKEKELFLARIKTLEEELEKEKKHGLIGTMRRISKEYERAKKRLLGK